MNRKSKKGVTLLELVIAMAILMIIITPIFSLTFNTVKFTSQAENKQKSLEIAQKHMEKIKAIDYADLVFNNGVYSNESEEEGLSVQETLVYVDRYKFPEDNINQNNGTAISYDLEINVGDTTITWVDTADISVVNNIAENLLTIVNNKKSDVKIKLLFTGNRTINLDLTNNNIDNFMDVYVVKSSESSASYSIRNSIGKIRIHSNIYNDSQSNSSNYRLYKITITVKKGEEELQKIEGYKTFLK